MLNQTIEIRQLLAIDAKHVETHGDAVSSSARFQDSSEFYRDGQGRARTADGVVYVPAGLSVSLGDRIDYDGKAYRVVKRVPARGFVGETVFAKLLVTLM